MSSRTHSLEHLCEHLLFSHECVVIPGMGGFIVRDSPCNFNAGMDKLKPFARHIFFNPHLNQNDGLLAAELMKRKGISYAEAIDHLNRATDQLRTDIDAGGSLRFGKLGTFFKGQENIWFAPESSLNLAHESYGLEPIDVRVLESSNNETPVAIPQTASLADRKPIEALEPEISRSAGIRPWLVAASVALVVHFAYLVFENPDKNQQTASMVPAISMPDSESTAYTADTATYAEQSTVSEIPDAESPAAETPVAESPAVETPVAESTVVESPAVETIETPAPAETRAAHYRLEANAVWHAADLQKKGISARVEQNKGGFDVLVPQTIISKENKQ